MQQSMFYMALPVISKYFFMLFLICFAHYCFSQNGELDSLIQQLPTLEKSKEKVKTYDRLLQLSLDTDMDKARSYGFRGLALAREIGDDLGMATIYKDLGVTHLMTYGYDSSWHYAALAKEKFHQLTKTTNGNDKFLATKGYAGTLGNMGNWFYYKGELDSAIHYHQMAIDLCDEKGLEQIKANSLNVLGVIYVKNLQFDNAIKIQLEALQTYEELGSLAGMSRAYQELSFISCEYQEKCNKAIEYLKKAVDIKLKIGDERGLGFVYSSMGNAYMDIGQHELAESYYDQSIVLAEKYGEFRLLLDNYSALNILWKELGKPDQDRIELLQKIIDLSQKVNYVEATYTAYQSLGSLHYYQGDFDKSIQYYNECIRLAKDYDDYSVLSGAYITLYDIYNNKRNNPTKAFEMLQQYVVNHDSVTNNERYRLVEEISTKYETEQKEKTIALLEKDQALKQAEIERRKSQMIFISLGALFLLGLAGMIYYRYRYKQRLKLEQMRTRIASDLHDEVGSSLSHLNLLIGSFDTENAPEITARAAEKSKEIMARTSSNIRDVVWAIDARRDKTGDLLDRMEDFAYDMLSNRNITYRFHSDGIKREDTLNPFVRQNIYLIYKEAINNIAKHSSATKVDIRLRQNGDKFEMTIADNGRSMNENKVKGQGLENMQLRAQRIGGKLDIHQGENGFTVSLKAPLNGK